MRPTVRAFFRIGRLTWRTSRGPALLVAVMMLLEPVAYAATSLGLRAVVNSALHHHLSGLILASVLTAASYTFTSAGSRIRSSFRDDITERVGVLLDEEIQHVCTTLEGIEHLERPDYLDRIALTRGRGQALADYSWAAVESATHLVRVATSLAILTSIHPALALISLFAAPPILLNRMRQKRIKQATVRTAELTRLERHLTRMCTEPAASKEVRIFGSGDELDRLADEAWHTATRNQTRPRVIGALLVLGGWSLFMLGYIAGLALAVQLAVDGRRTIGDVVLVVTLAGQLRTQIESAVKHMTRALASRQVLDAYLWLVGYATADTGTGPARLRAPTRLSRGITLSHVFLTYPGTQRQILRDITVHLPAGAMVAVVGEYGSGKTSLVKLLCKFYAPTSGEIRIDDTPLARIDTATWRGVTSAAFQDFGRYQTPAYEAVGIGDLPYVDDLARVGEALAVVGADDLGPALPRGLHTQLGDLFEGGVNLSGGQWQKLALGRAAMRTQPVLLVFDEPTASLDAPSEYAVFQRYGELARRLGAAVGAVTVVVSHRFSTVRMADLILVMREGELVEAGTHEQLVAGGGTYAQLYDLQAAAYGDSPRPHAEPYP